MVDVQTEVGGSSGGEATRIQKGEKGKQCLWRNVTVFSIWELGQSHSAILTAETV